MNAELKTKGFRLIDSVFADEAQLSSYNDCPHDPFMGNGTRYKRFSQYRLAPADGGWEVELLPARPYTALKQFNPVGGGFKRPYEPLLVDFSNIIVSLASELELDRTADWQINVHQNRSIAEAERNGQLTPEGRHQDGHKYVSISIFARENVAGGNTRLWETKESQSPLWEHTLMPGQTVLLDDHAVYHDVTEIEAENAPRGHRDILIIAYSRWEERWYGDEHDATVLDTGHKQQASK